MARFSSVVLVDDRGWILLQERDEHPEIDPECWGYCGGHLEEGEDFETAAYRELAEETGVQHIGDVPGRVHLEQLAAYGAPGRDPRMRVVSIAYLAFAAEMPEPRAGGDAADAAWTPIDALGLTGEGTQRPGTTRRLAFDHAVILTDGLERARAKLEYTALATTFCAPEFTIPELRAVYETVWGEELHAGNFHRKGADLRLQHQPRGGLGGVVRRDRHDLGGHHVLHAHLRPLPFRAVHWRGCGRSGWRARPPPPAPCAGAVGPPDAAR